MLLLARKLRQQYFQLKEIQPQLGQMSRLNLPSLMPD
jgi:hypothetical protein